MNNSNVFSLFIPGRLISPEISLVHPSTIMAILSRIDVEDI